MTDTNLLEAIRGVVREELTGFATKEDLKGFVTKEDLKSMEGRLETKFATKKDLEDLERRLGTKFATKENMKSMESRLNGKLNSIRNSNTQHHLRTREEVGSLSRGLGDMQEGLKQAAGVG